MTMAGRLILALAMLAGRIGPLSLILARARRRERPHFVYPEEFIAIG